MKDIIIKTIISAEPFMSDIYLKSPDHRNNCFELYGFDILIDNNFKPWLLEVNVCPSLNSSSPLDNKIKHSLLIDIFNLIGIIPYDKNKYEHDQKKKIPGSKSEENKAFSKNINDIKNLNYENCV